MPRFHQTTKRTAAKNAPAAKMARSAAGDSQEITRATDVRPAARTPPTRLRPKMERPTASKHPVDPEPAASPSPHLANLLQRWTGSRRGLHLALQAAALLFLGGLMASFGLGFLLERDLGQVQDNPGEGIQISTPGADPADLEKLDVALRALRNGDSSGAGALLDELLASPDRLTSLHSAAAFTAAHEQNRSRAQQGFCRRAAGIRGGFCP